MTERQLGDTALAVAALRAAHQLFDAPPWILDDPIAARLLDPATLARIQAHPEQFALPGVRALRAHVLVRSRYAEDRLAAAVQRGVRQCVMLGAGYDTFAYRQPAWAAPLRIFEIDHPAGQRAKQQRLAAAGIAVPANVEFVTVDIEAEPLAAGLRRSTFDPSRPAFLSWLGVMVYLSADAVTTVFRFAASLPSPSEIVFTFSPPADPGASDAGGPGSAAALAAAAGEPWLTRLTREQLQDLLKSLGFSSVTFLTPREAVAQYLGERRDGLPAPRGVRMGSASV